MFCLLTQHCHSRRPNSSNAHYRYPIILQSTGHFSTCQCLSRVKSKQQRTNCQCPVECFGTLFSNITQGFASTRLVVTRKHTFDTATLCVACCWESCPGASLKTATIRVLPNPPFPLCTAVIGAFGPFNERS